MNIQGSTVAQELPLANSASERTLAALPDRPIHAAAKRLVDVTLSLAALLVLSPLLLLVAIAVRIDSDGPAIFRQERIGRHGRRFTMLKFRSMRANADDSIHRESVRRTALGIRTSLADGREVFKSPDDPRITRVGRIIRATCIDELPQLINVLRGDMSLVGPRPALAYELPFYKNWHFGRFNAVPGITGLWQVTRSTGTDFDDMMAMDIDYALTSTIRQDLSLIVLTIPAVIRDRGVF